MADIKVVIKNSSFKMGEGGKFIRSRAGQTLDIGMADVEMEGLDTFLDVKDSPTLMDQLGLPRGTPPELLLEALRTLEASKGVPIEAKAAVLGESRLSKQLAEVANGGQIIQTLLALEDIRHAQFQQDNRVRNARAG